jgi:hypothetical protein
MVHKGHGCLIDVLAGRHTRKTGCSKQIPGSVYVSKADGVRKPWGRGCYKFIFPHTLLTHLTSHAHVQ